MKQSIASILTVAICLIFLGSTAYSADNSDLKHATDREIVLEFGLIQAQVKELNQTLQEKQARLQALSAEAQSRPSIVGTGGVQAPKDTKKAKKKQ
jgi:hypothetical protein